MTMRMTTTNVTAPPTTAASNCLRGGSGEQGDGKWEMRTKTGEVGGTATDGFQVLETRETARRGHNHNKEKRETAGRGTMTNGEGDTKEQGGMNGEGNDNHHHHHFLVALFSSHLLIESTRVVSTKKINLKVTQLKFLK
jgi:hypothetical protein